MFQAETQNQHRIECLSYHNSIIRLFGNSIIQRNQYANHQLGDTHMTTRIIVIVAISLAAVIGMVFMGKAMDGKEKEQKEA